MVTDTAGEALSWVDEAEDELVLELVVLEISDIVMAEGAMMGGGGRALLDLQLSGGEYAFPCRASTSFTLRAAFIALVILGFRVAGASWCLLGLTYLDVTSPAINTAVAGLGVSLAWPH